MRHLNEHISINNSRHSRTTRYSNFNAGLEPHCSDYSVFLSSYHLHIAEKFSRSLPLFPAITNAATSEKIESIKEDKQERLIYSFLEKRIDCRQPSCLHFPRASHGLVSFAAVFSNLVPRAFSSTIFQDGGSSVEDPGTQQKSRDQFCPGKWKFIQNGGQDKE